MSGRRAPEPAPGLPRPLRLLLALASRLAPPSERRRWRREWEAELLEHFGPPEEWNAGVRRRARFRAAGAFIDAARYRLEGWAADTRETGRGLMTGGELGRAWRSWRRSPGALAAAVATLALGIGATTTLYAVVDRVLLRPFGYVDEDRLMALAGYREGEPAGSGNVSYPNIRDWAARVSSLEGAVGVSGWDPALTTEGRILVTRGQTVSWDLFELLGVEAAVGRTFRPDEEGEGRDPVVVLSHGLWEAAFGADPGVVGRTIDANGTLYRVIGVMPRGFQPPPLWRDDPPARIWRTPWFDAAGWFRSGRSWRGLARLADGVDRRAADAELDAVMTSLAEGYPEENRGRRVDLVPLRESVLGSAAPALAAVFGGVLLVLAVACLNVANLVLQRLTERRRELDVRVALGASRGRLLASLLADGAVLAVGGGVLGVLLAFQGVEVVEGLVGTSLPRAQDLAVDPRVLVTAAVVTAGTALLLGLAPMVSVGKDVGRTAAPRGPAGDGGGRRLRNVLLALQLATAVVLLAGSGLLARSLGNLYAVDLGVDVDDGVALALHGRSMFERSRNEAASVYRAMLDEIAAVPGVTRVGAVDIVPLGSNYSCDGTTPLDRPPPPAGEGRCTQVRSVSPGFLEALGLPLVAGRLPTWSDDDGTDGVAVVDELTARTFWPASDPLGRSLLVHGDTFTVVGVVGAMRSFGPDAEAEPHTFLAAPQEPWNGMVRDFEILVRGAPGIEDRIPELLAAVERADPGVAVRGARSLEELLDERLAAYRFRASLFDVFAALTLALSVLGLAAGVSYAVARRRPEFGVRLALGARGRDVTAGVLVDVLKVVAAGTALGWVVALLGARALGSLLYGVRPADPLVFGIVPAVLVATALLAAWIPARRAGRVDPVTSLRAE